MNTHRSIVKDIPWQQNMAFLIIFILALMAFAVLTKDDNTTEELAYYPQEDNNSCWNPDANAEWEMLIAKYPHDIGVHTLYSLRIGLCFEVERNYLTIEKATKIFEGMRTSLIRSMERQNQLGNLNKKHKI